MHRQGISGDGKSLRFSDCTVTPNPMLNDVSILTVSKCTECKWLEKDTILNFIPLGQIIARLYLTQVSWEFAFILSMMTILRFIQA